MTTAPEMNLETQHMLTAEVSRIAEEIAYRYNNLRLVFIPEGLRETEAEKNYPYAVYDSLTGNVIRKFSQETVFRALDWLWENDSQRVDTYSAFMKNKEKVETAAKVKAQEANKEKFEVASYLAFGPKHTPKHNGIKFDDSYKASMKGVLGPQEG